MSKDILSVIQTNMSTFSKGQKLIAGFILESYDKAAFMTASRLGTSHCPITFIASMVAGESVGNGVMFMVPPYRSFKNTA